MKRGRESNNVFKAKWMLTLIRIEKAKYLKVSRDPMNPYACRVEAFAAGNENGGHAIEEVWLEEKTAGFDEALDILRDSGQAESSDCW